MATPPAKELTRLLLDWSNGDQAAFQELMPLVYEELRQMAHRRMSHERPGHTLQTTALLNEAYLRLIDQKRVRWKNRAQFFAVAAQAMRRILIDHARKRRYAKRGRGARRILFEEAAVMSDERSAELLALAETLFSLASIDPQQSRLVELRFFGGLAIEETSEVLRLFVDMVKRIGLLRRHASFER
jgi:RNA polymerase sigma factor (TIGR02999 family)